MVIERELRDEQLDSPDITIVGHGNIGEKARQLFDKTPELKRIGFSVPHRTVLAEGFFDGFFQRNSLGASLRDVQHTQDLAVRIRRGSFSFNDFNRLQLINAGYGDSPLVIRSSAEGDARGTGTYKSEFTENRIREARKALQRVLASYYSTSAIAFRKDAKTGEGFGIIVEPMIGQEIGGEYSSVFAPVLSGFAYTSTSSGEGYINVVPGIGGGVETRDGERLTRATLEPYEGSLDAYIDKQRDLMIYGVIAKRRSALLRTTGHGYTGDYDGRAYFAPTRWQKGGAHLTSIDIDHNLHREFSRLNLNELFDRLQTVEQAFGKSQYLEWAMTLEEGQPRYWIIQIADVDKKLDAFDFEDFGQSFVEGHSVTGSGIIESDLVISCMDAENVNQLRDFNQNHKGYVLFYTADLTSGGKNMYRDAHGGRKLVYSDVNNASVLVEIGNAQHNGDPLAHFQGQLDMTGKLFAVTELDPYDQEFWDKWYGFWDKADISAGIRVLQKKLKVVGSERQNKLAIYELQ